MTMFGKEIVQYGLPLRGRHEAWIYRRSTRLVPLLLRAKAKAGRTAAGIVKPGDNDNLAGQAAPNMHGQRDWEPSLVAK
ncbi:hypothetical protein FHU13_000009 [Methylobacterium sp. R2-1]|nr:hypothetical protein [Methylobacterium sp. R2-1]